MGDQPTEQELTQLALVGLPFIAVAVAVALFVLVLFAAMLIRAARYPGLTPLIAPLAMLSALALVAGAVGGPTELLAIGATGVGALAGALSTVFQQPPADTPTQGAGQMPEQD